MQKNLKKVIAVSACVAMMMAMVGCSKKPVQEPITEPTTEFSEEDLFESIFDDGSVIVLPPVTVDEDWETVTDSTEAVTEGSSLEGSDNNTFPTISDDEENTPTVTEPIKPKPTDSPATEGNDTLPGVSDGDTWDDAGSDELPGISGDEEW